MSRPRKPIGAAIAPYQPVTDQEWDHLFLLVFGAGSLSAAIRAVLGAGRDGSTIYNAIRRDPIGLGRRLEQAKQAFRDKLLHALVQRGVEGVDRAVRWKGDVVGYEKEFSDAALLAACRHFLGEHGWVDKRSVSDTTVHHANTEPDVIFALSYEQAERLPVEMKRALLPVLRWIKEDQRARNRDEPLMIEAEAVPESDDGLSADDSRMLAELCT